MAYPVARKLTRMSGGFGPRKPINLGGGRFSPSFHGGVDFTPLERGSRIPAYAVGAGTVYAINLGGGAAGLNVMLRLDGDESLWWYGHLSRVDVRKGQRVRDGQQLGIIGATGNTTGVHLHLERHWPRIDVETDPWPYIKDARDINGHTSSWQTGTPPAATGDTNTAAPAIDQEGDMHVIKNTKTGHVYHADTQFLRHETHGPAADRAAKHTPAGKVLELNDGDFKEFLNARGIPLDAATAVLSGKLWSPTTGLLDARTLKV